MAAEREDPSRFGPRRYGTAPRIFPRRACFILWIREIFFSRTPLLGDGRNRRGLRRQDRTPDARGPCFAVIPVPADRGYIPIITSVFRRRRTP